MYLRIVGGLILIGGVAAGFIYLQPLMQKLHQLDIQESSGQPTGITAVPFILTCSSDQARALALEVVRKNPPFGLQMDATLLNVGACDSQLQEAKHARESCWENAGVSLNSSGDPYCATQSCPRAADCDPPYAAAEERKKACSATASDDRKNTSYRIEDIRLESRDATTGAVVCNASVVAETPHGVGSAKEDVTYKLEKMEDGSGLHIEMSGLH